MTETKSYSYRMDPQDHDKAAKVLNDLGLDSTTAIKIFMKQVVQTQGIPFEIKKSNPEISEEMEKDIEASDQEYKEKNYKSFSNVNDLLEDLKK